MNYPFYRCFVLLLFCFCSNTAPKASLVRRYRRGVEIFMLGSVVTFLTVFGKV